MLLFCMINTDRSVCDEKEEEKKKNNENNEKN